VADNELLIKINADAKNAEKAFDDVRSSSESLENHLSKVAKVSAVAFAAFTAEVAFSVKAFHEAEQASMQLSNALQNQGIYTADLAAQYKKYASEVQAATGIDDDAITKSQAVAQAYLGQMKITKEMTQAIADLSTETGSLDSAAEKIAKTVGTNINAFAREGLQLDATASKQERLAKVLEFVNTRYGDMAAAQNKAGGGMLALQTAFGNLQEAIGARFAPVIEVITSKLTQFFTYIGENEELVNLTVAITAAGLAISALGVAIPLAVTALGVLKAALAAMQISATAGRLAIYGLAGATGIGLLVIAVTELVLHWDAAWKTIKAVTYSTGTFLAETFSGIGKALKGAFTLSPDLISQGLAQIRGAFSKSKEEYVSLQKESTAETVKETDKQDEKKKESADKQTSIERQKQALLKQIRRAETELIILETENASKALIELKTQEISTLKALNEEHSATEIGALRNKLTTIQQLQEQQQQEDIDRTTEFLAIKAEQQGEFEKLSIDATAELRRQQSAELQASLYSDAEAERKIVMDTLKFKIEARNKELIDRKLYGETVATINKALGAEEVTAAKSAADSLVQLSQSKNDTLKSIGKAAAITQIGIDTGKGAMAVYANFQTAIPYPPVSIPLGLAAAGAIVAYGAERIGQVTAAKDGGVITGGVPGMDSVPALLAPGELVVPEQNFDQVVGAVRGEGQDNSQVVALLANIDSKLQQPTQIVVQGDMLADDSYIDSLVKKISDAIEFRNAKIVGVNI
jgi:hypothetical protein